jgi:WD40 repeat protein
MVRQRAAIFFLILLSCVSLTAYAEVDSRPFLRLNPLIHTEMINRSALGMDNSVLATVSDDKTVRLWEFPQGRLFRILRPPIADGNEGKLFAVALSPQNLLVAVGGWIKSGYRGFGNHNIYFFDGSNGEIVNRVSGLENVVLHLNFSPDVRFEDGKMTGYLAASLADMRGIRVWRLSNFSEVLRDMTYKNDSYWVEFSSDGKKLVSSCYDGYIRLYTWDENGNKMRLQTKVRIKDQNTPFALRFSPDGQRIAASFSEASKVAILSSHDLSVLGWTDTIKGGTGDLFLNAWSSDGKTLYAGGGFSKDGIQTIVRWDNMGNSTPTLWPVAWNTLMGLHTLEDGQIVYTSSSPEWGMLDNKGQALITVPNEKVYFNKIFPQGFSVSENAQIVQFEHDTLERKALMRFSLTEQRLYEVPPPPPQSGETASSTPEPPKMEVREAQQRLIDKGLFSGPIDNLMRTKTRLALKDYQEAVQLPKSGELDAATIAAFLAEDAEKQKPFEVFPPILTAPDLEIKAWKNSDQPLLNGKPLPLSKNDTALCYAFSPNGDTLVLGTRFRLFNYDKTGKLNWQINSPGIVWAVNIAGNGKILVAAFSDGTLRWFKLEDGTELMALYPHADGRRWLAWSPDGIYAASVGADKLGGWHVNNAVDQAADFYPFSSVRERYYQPQTLVNALSVTEQPAPENTAAKLMASMETAQATTTGTRNTSETANLFPTEFPPRVLILSPKDGSSFSTPEIELSYQLRFHGKAEPSELRVMLDSYLFKTIKAADQADPTQGTINLTLPPRTVELSLLAKNKHGVSPTELVLLAWEGEAQPRAQPALYILSIGISDYTDANVGDLPFAHSDAAAFSATWAAQKGLYRKINIKNIQNGSYNQVIEGFEWLRQEAKIEDVVMIFFAGHSVQHRDSRKNTYFFLPVDATPTSNTISTTILLEALGTIPGKVMLWLDTAYFEHLGVKSDQLSSSDVNGVANELSSAENSLLVFASSVGTQSAHWNEGGGLFVSTLNEALAGNSDQDGDGKISLKEMAHYISRRVSELSAGMQTPILAMPETIGDFHIANVIRAQANNTDDRALPTP